MSQGAIYGFTTPFGHGRAFSQPLLGTSPAAGSGYSLTVSGAYYERFTTCRFTLTTSATVASRAVTVDYVKPGTGIFYSAGPTVLQTASSTGVYDGTIGFGASDWNTGTPAWFSLPDIILPSGYQLQINVANIQTADTLTAISFIRERFQTGEDGFPVGWVDSEDLPALYDTLGD